MKQNGDVDQLLHEAGARWRAAQAAPPEPDFSRLGRRGMLGRAAPLGRVLFGLGTAGVLLAVLVVSLPSLGNLQGSDASPSGPLATEAALSPGPSPSVQPDSFIWFEAVRLSEDGRTVHLTFTGAAPYSPSNPCSVDYAAAAEIVGEVLEVAIREIDHSDQAPIPPGAPCTSEGYPRELSADLAEPFTGYEVVDRAGYVHFLSRPDGVAELGLPEGWLLDSEATLIQSPTGRWRQTYTRPAELPSSGSAGRLDFIQAFNGPAHIEGVDEQPPVEVNGAPARLWTWPESGELVLVWQLGPHGLALVANEQDFSVQELIALADTARLPAGVGPDPTSPLEPSASPPVPSASPSTGGGSNQLANLRWRTITLPFEGPLEQGVNGIFKNSRGHIIAWGPDHEDGYTTVAFWHTTDLETWREAKLGESGQFIDVYAVADSPRGVVAAGSLEGRAMVWWSPEGEAWQQATVSPANGWSRSRIRAVAANETGFLAVGVRSGSMAAWFSPDGRNWQLVDERGFGTGALHDVTVLPDGRFVAVGVDESRRDWDAASWTVSADGSDWRATETNGAVAGPDDEVFWRVWPFAGGLLGLVEHHDTGQRLACDGPCLDESWSLFTSVDGARWERRAEAPMAGDPSSPLRLWEFSAIAAWGDGLLAVGAGTDWQVRLWYSADGVSWEPIGDALRINGEPAPGYQRDTVNDLLVDGDRLIVGGGLGGVRSDGFIMVGEP